LFAHESLHVLLQVRPFLFLLLLLPLVLSFLLLLLMRVAHRLRALPSKAHLKPCFCCSAEGALKVSERPSLLRCYCRGSSSCSSNCPVLFTHAAADAADAAAAQGEEASVPIAISN
jgi:hypothetical protein